MMQRVIYLLVLALTLSCQSKRGIDNSLTPYYTPKYAESFSIGTDSLSRKVLTITNPYQSSKPFEQRVYLLEEGQTAPAEAIAVRVPAERVAVLSSSHVAMLDAAGVADRVVGVSGLRFITNQKVKATAVEIGYDSALDFEALKAAGTDVILLYGLYGEDSGTTSKLKQLGIPYIYIGDYIEPSPLAKAEWVVALAAVCGVHSRGEEYFNALELRYNALKEQALSYTSRPKVMLNTPYRDTWFMPSVESYAVQLITDAGGEYIYTKNTTAESLPISLEEALLLASSADVWINVGQTASLAELKSTNPKFANIPAVLSGRVFNNTKRTTAAGGSDFWESGAVNPDIVLRDMIRLLHTDPCADSLYYYKRLE